MTARAKKPKGRGQLLHEAMTGIGNTASDIAATCNESMFLTSDQVKAVKAQAAAIAQLCEEYEKANTP